MKFLLYDEEGVLLRKFWSKDAAELYLQTGGCEGYKIVVLKKPRGKRVLKSMAELYPDLQDPPF